MTTPKLPPPALRRAQKRQSFSEAGESDSPIVMREPSAVATIASVMVLALILELRVKGRGERQG